MVELVLSPLLDVLMGNLIFAASDEIKMLRGVEKEVDRLRCTLSSIRAVLEDAEEKQVNSKAVNEWLRKLKGVVYDADDVLDEFITDARREKLEGVPQTSKRRQVSKLFSCLCANEVLARHEMGLKIKEIRERLDHIGKERSHFHLKSSDQGRPFKNAIERSKIGSIVDESEVFGRYDDKEKLIQNLLSNESKAKNVSVLPIVGMGGKGKTTLAQLLYNDKRVENQFEVRAWVCVSDSFDVTRITKEILESATKTQCESLGIEPVQRRLLEILTGKKFIIVLDDVWNEDPIDWKILGLPFKDGAKGSMVIVTTRSVKVAQIMGTIPTHHLEVLPEDDSWKLFVRMAFGEESYNTHQKLANIGEKIVRKCGGLPLAIKTLGGLLSTTRNQSVWESVLESRIWDVPGSNNGILAALRLSYYHLPANLKQCFAYCSLFPKAYVFDKDELVKIWMGEGYIKPKAGIQMEDAGQELFDDLLSRSFFQHSYTDILKKDRYIMHDLVHDVAEFVSKEECLRFEREPPFDIPENARHSSIVFCEEFELIKLCDLNRCKSIRTFLHLSYFERLPMGASLDLLLKFKCLRVLSLHMIDIDELPNSIGNLKHLRYLDLSRTDIVALPESISRLNNLQTLKLEGCEKLTELPKGITNLINLRHLEIQGSRLSYLPFGIGKLSQLATLPSFIVGSEGNGCRIGELKGMVNLKGAIEISKLNNVANKEEARQAALKDKKHLHKLRLEWESEHDSFQDEDVLEGLQHHTNLKELEIFDYKGVNLIPSWFSRCDQMITFTNLVSIELYNCTECQNLPPLGQLPSLTYLTLWGMDELRRLDHKFCGVNGFPSLKHLLLLLLPNLEEWCGEEGGGDYMPCLHDLIIQSCPKLKQLPQHLSPALSKLSINYCDELIGELNFPSLEEFKLQFSNEMLLRYVPYLTSLKVLNTSLYSSSLCLPNSITSLNISGAGCMESLDLQNLVSLQDLTIHGCSELSRFYPPLNLVRLLISNCLLLESLPSNLHNLTHLQHLRLVGCDNLASLPKKGLPTTLDHLTIRRCPILYDRCKNETGEDWPKIAHVPNLNISGELDRQY